MTILVDATFTFDNSNQDLIERFERAMVMARVHQAGTVGTQGETIYHLKREKKDAIKIILGLFKRQMTDYVEYDDRDLARDAMWQTARDLTSFCQSFVIR